MDPGPSYPRLSRRTTPADRSAWRSAARTSPRTRYCPAIVTPTSEKSSTLGRYRGLGQRTASPGELRSAGLWRDSKAISIRRADLNRWGPCTYVWVDHVEVALIDMWSGDNGISAGRPGPPLWSRANLQCCNGRWQTPPWVATDIRGAPGRRRTGAIPSPNAQVLRNQRSDQCR